MSVDGHWDWKEKYVGIQRVRRQREHSLLCQHWYTHLGAIERLGGRRRMMDYALHRQYTSGTLL